MATKKTSILEKNNQTELRIKELVKQRNKELLDIITRFNAISIDNNLLSGFKPSYYLSLCVIGYLDLLSNWLYKLSF